jgi:hypothetical protein
VLSPETRACDKQTVNIGGDIFPQFRHFSMLSRVSFALAVLACTPPPAFAGTVLFTDNFNAPDISNFDNSSLTGRRGGLLGSALQLRSALVQHSISGNQLKFALETGGGEGRIRFQDSANLSVWHDFAAGVAAATILYEGGLRVEFDWKPVNNTDPNWVEVSIGIDGQAIPEPAYRVTAPGTDFGILFRHNGGSQYFRNGTGVGGLTFSATAAARHVKIDYAFTSFADGATVVASATVDGLAAATNQVFQWHGNGGKILLEFGSQVGNELIDNLSVRTLGPDGFLPRLDRPAFFSSSVAGDLVGELSGATNGVAENGTFSLVAGDGSSDNAKFQITGNRLETSGFNFLPAADGTRYSVRVRGTGSTSGTSAEKAIMLTTIADVDSDKLADAWELAKAGSLTTLNGLGAGPGPGAGTGNFDGDSLSDAEEYALSLSAYPNINPMLADSDGDGLEDGAETAGAGSRPPTDPTLADTDSDGLSDAVETNTGLYGGALNTGTNPVLASSDGDYFPDGYEIQRGSNPLNTTSIPSLPPDFAAVRLTTDASSGISPAITYTHAISGGYGATINGVGLSPLNTTTMPPRFTWTASGSRNAFTSQQYGNWIPANGGVTGSGLLNLFGGLCYSDTGGNPGGTQRYVLSGLEAGKWYETRLYMRAWTTGAFGRPIDLRFTNGSKVAQPFPPIGLPEDRPSVVLNGGASDDAAYYLSYVYAAEGTTLVIDATVPATASPGSGSFHFYGLTNSMIPPLLPLDFVSSVRAANGSSVTLTLRSRPNRIYAVDFTTALAPEGQGGGWLELLDNLQSTGTQTVYVDTIASGLPRAFYRIRDVTPP